MDETKTLSIAQQLMRAGIGKSYAYMIQSGERSPALPLALQIHEKTGLKLGPLTGATDEQIATLANLPSVEAAA